MSEAMSADDVVESVTTMTIGPTDVVVVRVREHGDAGAVARTIARERKNIPLLARLPFIVTREDHFDIDLLNDDDARMLYERLGMRLEAPGAVLLNEPWEAPMEQQPSQGRVVLFVERDYGSITASDQVKFTTWPATIVLVHPDGRVGLNVSKPYGMLEWQEAVPYSAEPAESSWHWPPRVG